MNRKLDSPLLGALLLNFHYLEGVDFIVGGLYGLRSYCIMDLWVLWLDLHCFVTGVTASFPGISVFSIPLDYLALIYCLCLRIYSLDPSKVEYQLSLSFLR